MFLLPVNNSRFDTKKLQEYFASNNQTLSLYKMFQNFMVSISMFYVLFTR